ncbi:hypothetical protein GCM10009566_28750 [Streptomyces murinus]|uniref:Fructose-1,6-bisphosphatase/sedoheptulose 1,7-bisphosphatase-like protein n=1 Tax=Streptomyces murinus TaxID=33900 RepID=A0A7W3NVP1_STRMR|nr:fructose-1,6-bisphosphatase/sedoheptulose 1,7-bisphosphatase-like protein [Streptomyces murinus]
MSEPQSADGDVVGAILAAREDSGMEDLMLGIGGPPKESSRPAP